MYYKQMEMVFLIGKKLLETGFDGAQKAKTRRILLILDLTLDILSKDVRV